MAYSNACLLHRASHPALNKRLQVARRYCLSHAPGPEVEGIQIMAGATVDVVDSIPVFQVVQKLLFLNQPQQVLGKGPAGSFILDRVALGLARGESSQVKAGQLYLFEGGTHYPGLRIHCIGSTIEGEEHQHGRAHREAMDVSSGQQLPYFEDNIYCLTCVVVFGHWRQAADARNFGFVAQDRYHVVQGAPQCLSVVTVEHGHQSEALGNLAISLG